MRQLWLVIALSWVAAAPAEARGVKDPSEARKRHTSPSCEHYYWICKSRHPDHLAGCEILWNAVRKSGETAAIWDDPEAAAAAHFGSSSRPCLN